MMNPIGRGLRALAPRRRCTRVVLAEMYKVQGGRACGMVCFHSDEAKIEAGDGRGDAGDFGDADS